jgi:hypothetical protein
MPHWDTRGQLAHRSGAAKRVNLGLKWCILIDIDLDRVVRANIDRLNEADLEQRARRYLCSQKPIPAHSLRDGLRIMVGWKVMHLPAHRRRET